MEDLFLGDLRNWVGSHEAATQEETTAAHWVPQILVFCRTKTLHKNSPVSQFRLKSRSFLSPHSEEFLLHSHSEEICFQQLYFFF